MRSISSSVTVSAVRSYSFVVLGDAWPAILLRVLERPPVRQIRRDARRPERVAARRRRQTRRRRTTLDHRQHHAPRQRPAAQPPRPVDALKQRRLRLLDPAGDQIRFDRRLGPVMGRHVVPLAPLLVQPQPPPSPLQEIVLTTHPHDRAHPREAVHHHAQQRPVTKTHQRPRVDPIEQRPRLGRRQHRRRPLGHHVLRAPHRRGRIHRQHLVDDQPVAQHPDGGQVLLDRRRRPRMRTDIRRHVQRRDRAQAQAPSRTPRQEPPRRSRIRRARPGVGDLRREELQDRSTATGPVSTITAGSAMPADPAGATGRRVTAGTSASRGASETPIQDVIHPSDPAGSQGLRTTRVSRRSRRRRRLQRQRQQLADRVPRPRTAVPRRPLPLVPPRGKMTPASP